MKPSANFKKPAKKPKALKDELEEYRNQIVELGQELEQVKHELKSQVKARIEAGFEDAKSFIIAQARDHFQGREDSILRRLHGFLKQELFWEHKTIYASSVSAKQVEELTRQGYTYLQTVYNPDETDVTKRHGTIYRRALIPGSYGEFKELYEKWILATKESKQKRKDDEKRREASAKKVDEEVAQAERKKRKLAKKKAAAETAD